MEFGEYENEECAKANEVVKQLLEAYDGKIRFQFRHFPLTLIHQRSLKASESAVAPDKKVSFGKCTIFFLPIVAIWVLQVSNYIQKKQVLKAKNS
jgi:hypothetical protein